MTWEAPEVAKKREEAAKKREEDKRKKQLVALLARKAKSEKQLASATSAVAFTQGQLKAKREKIPGISQDIADQKAILKKLIDAKKKGKPISADEKTSALKKIQELSLTLKSVQAAIKNAERHATKAQSTLKIRKSMHVRTCELLEKAQAAGAAAEATEKAEAAKEEARVQAEEAQALQDQANRDDTAAMSPVPPPPTRGVPPDDADREPAAPPPPTDTTIGTTSSSTSMSS